ncbi:glycosyltransferase family 9 protein [Vibrio gazogenes]|uniref:Heptosyltransferase-3 n=1 Tax=Vibrio gazogenes DSM 21264 = NBRC 103151 TaxID=1123492 RepID=A0A1M5D2A7_VIBGA|nr:glycosyltransferase family 9 protein [Vibrio gazogenes]USP13926.1 glycosyltransferase family 9 protein [Vibrio gazogenes]SHF61040.1 heptosyltransferase-3 [Vibrio gazogenes DSM 21264] [Vibrio gazogenes DSM 21264 = NBRC 103151]SJN56672.1 Lipopolysaccharide core heptosyltransferase RfaQ [Vibrio gazogenes]
MKILIISARNFGDSVIITHLIENINTDNLYIDVLTRKEFIPIFRHCKCIHKIYTENFPMGTSKKFNIINAISLLKRILNLRKYNYDMVFNNIGDFRENFLGWSIGSKENISVKWYESHPVNSIIRSGFHIFVDKYIEIPKNILNIYQVQKYIKFKLFGGSDSTENIIQSMDYSFNIIAIHPYASQRSKFWEYENWIQLIEQFGTEERKVIVFCSPSERDELDCAFSSVKKKIFIVAKGIDEFLETLKCVTVFIGLDSFSIHAAYMMNVPNLIMLNGANDSRVWAPPMVEVFGGGSNCEHYPCYNKPKCIGKEYEYICMRSIKTDDIVKKIREMEVNVSFKGDE